MKIQVLGTGCPKCKQLMENAKKAFPGAAVEKVDDIDKILEFGVMMTPALVVDGKVLSSGKVPSPEDMKKLVK